MQAEHWKLVLIAGQFETENKNAELGMRVEPPCAELEPTATDLRLQTEKRPETELSLALVPEKVALEPLAPF